MRWAVCRIRRGRRWAASCDDRAGQRPGRPRPARCAGSAGGLPGGGGFRAGGAAGGAQPHQGAQGVANSPVSTAAAGSAGWFPCGGLSRGTEQAGGRDGECGSCEDDLESGPSSLPPSLPLPRYCWCTASATAARHSPVPTRSTRAAAPRARSSTSPSTGTRPTTSARSDTTIPPTDGAATFRPRAPDRQRCSGGPSRVRQSLRLRHQRAKQLRVRWDPPRGQSPPRLNPGPPEQSGAERPPGPGRSGRGRRPRGRGRWLGRLRAESSRRVARWRVRKRY